MTEDLFGFVGLGFGRGFVGLWFEKVLVEKKKTKMKLEWELGRVPLDIVLCGLS